MPRVSTTRREGTRPPTPATPMIISAGADATLSGGPIAIGPSTTDGGECGVDGRVEFVMEDFFDRYKIPSMYGVRWDFDDR